MSAAGSLTNPTRIANHIGTISGKSPNPKTVSKYLEFLEDAYLFSKADRHGIKGREYLSTPSKYYPADIGLRNARLNFRQVEQDHLMECAIYNELRSRGLSVCVGMLEVVAGNADGKRERKQLEIDFIVNNGQQRLYIQSAYWLPDASKCEQEIRGLRRIPDSFGKLISVDGIQPLYTDEHGISYMSLMDFMLKPELIA